jgi:hypothetical protein
LGPRNAIILHLGAVGDQFNGRIASLERRNYFAPYSRNSGSYMLGGKMID